jgi:membrane protein DedA with SNARE-associated domain
MSLELLLARYGYPALVAGTAMEGETILVIAGFLAHRGYLALPYVILAAFLGTFAGDQFYFHLGQKSGAALLERRPKWQAKACRARALFERHRIPIVLGFRFLYGLRIVTPFVIGMSGFSAKLFVVLNAISAIIWAIVISCLGYGFGGFLSVLLKDVKHWEKWIILGMLVVGGLAWLRHHIRRQRRECKNRTFFTDLP